MKTTITKVFTDIPFAHRQSQHEGHCRFVHGHNWTIEVTLSAEVPDKNGFVYDFGKMSFLKEWINHNLDHAIVLGSEDKFLNYFSMEKKVGMPLLEAVNLVENTLSMEHTELCESPQDSIFMKALLMEGTDVSCEALARFLALKFQRLFDIYSKDRAIKVEKLKLWEDSKNYCEVVNE